jgi:hypothetical protein
VTEKDITGSLIRQEVFCGIRGLIWLPQQRMGCGYGNDFERTIDVFGISTHKPWTRVAIEIKLSRQDFCADTRQPLKQRRARMIANQFFYVTPPGLLDPEDIPIWAGGAT